MTENRDDALARDVREALRIIARCMEVIARDTDDRGRRSELISRIGELNDISTNILRTHDI